MKIKEYDEMMHYLQRPGNKLINFPKQTKPIIKQKHKFELQKEVEELKNQNKVLANNQKPLPDNVENVQYEPATGTFKGQSTGKDYHGNEAIKMNEQYDRISPADKNTLKRIERIKYEHNELKEKPLWLEKEEEHNKKLKNHTLPKLTNLPVVNRNINQKLPRRDTWKEFVASGGKELPKLSHEEIENVRGNKRVRDYMINEDKKEKKKFADEVSNQIKSVHTSRLAEESVPLQPWKPAPTVISRPPISPQRAVINEAKEIPGISEDLVRLQSAIRRNIDYVLGTDEKDRKNIKPEEDDQ